MPAGKLHADEVETNTSLVGRLVAAQFPRWAGLPIEPVPSAGTDNVLYRLGDELAIRLPRTERVTWRLEKEHAWLPKLAPHLPLAIPEPLAMGEPGEGYAWRWSVLHQLDGEDAITGHIADPIDAATRLAQFITALQRIDPTGGPPPGPGNFFRGVPLAMRDESTRAAIKALEGIIDTAAAAEAWDAALAAPEWDRPPAWIHGDLLPGNLLVRQGRLSAVIDFGGLGVGDPACDLLPAWTLFSGESREAFRDALAVDGDTWARGRGWALSQALIFIPYYLHSNPECVAIARRTVAEVLADR